MYVCVCIVLFGFVYGPLWIFLCIGYYIIVGIINILSGNRVCWADSVTNYEIANVHIEPGSYQIVNILGLICVYS